MGRRPARATHLGLSIVGAALYIVFIIPRWWVLTGDFPATLGTVGRIAAGVPVAAAAVPVMLDLQRSLTAVPKPPELALRLRAWSAVLHVIAGILIVATAVAEIWLSLQVAGPWLFAVYGAAGAIAVLAIVAFVLSFTAEKPPAPPKPPKAKKEKPARVKKQKRSRKRGSEEAEAEAESGDVDASEETAQTKAAAEDVAAEDRTDATEATETPVDGDPETSAADQPAADDLTETADSEAPAPSSGALLNQRPTGKKRHRLRR